MTIPEKVYRDNMVRYEHALKVVRKQLRLISMLRVLTFVLMALSMYVFYPVAVMMIAPALAGVVLFLVLVVRHNRSRQQKKKLEELLALNHTEVRVLHGDFKDLPDGSEFTDPLHAYSNDTDLFGPGSFFQYLNRTGLISGRAKLAAWLTANNTERISERQEAVRELAGKTAFRQEFTATARMMKGRTPAEEIKKWMERHTPFVPAAMRWLPAVFTAGSGVLLVLFFTGMVPGIWILLYYVAGLLLTGSRLRKINALAVHTGRIQDFFLRYRQLLELLEKESFSAPVLAALRGHITAPGKNASWLLRQLARAIDAFDQRNNMIMALLGNGFLLWDLRQCYRIEQWILAHRDKVGQWFDTVSAVDACNSLGNFAFNHPDYVFPEITDREVVLETKGAVHPLIPADKAVRNDYTIARENFFIITGANMAGKSTFLRTVSLQIIMGNGGLPVCARSCSYSPVKLVTSMRTVDSLSDEASYFYAELSRLKYIVNTLQGEEHRYFVVLDEILKGTNSTDKAIGSRKFVEKLVALGATGIIATHDLSLCEAADVLPQVSNYYFDAEITNDELYFDYRFKKGVCRNMNASFLLKKMKIVDG
ncbi:MutS-related protein [Sinomicrobium soli]|uniref:MutS-related protein n=1 Tax=Sinomicrobium sp. N-1-3-6 TaxID=2219864 RepID=UPI000DCB4553|nr:DNA mismatch repair protein MutS [Sinomicrobium sp. N-1-3-6]RAV27479.1 DNA mismatch repair protein MutS [Sinomicrobium sp. N-1-3-6]